MGTSLCLFNLGAACASLCEVCGRSCYLLHAAGGEMMPMLVGPAVPQTLELMLLVTASEVGSNRE